MPSSRTAQSDLEAKLARFVRSYILAFKGDSQEEQEALRWLCCGLGRLLGGLLEGSNGWGSWVDGIVPATDVLPGSISVISPDEVSLRGRAD
jgi:hypothetical protein